MTSARTWLRLAGLPLQVDGYGLEGLVRSVSSGFERRTTLIALQGGGAIGHGEDVTYDADEHGRQQDAGPIHDLAGDHTLGTFTQRVGALDLFPAGAPEHAAYRLYRRWAYESAGLDLALRQNGLSLAGVLAREPRPVTFVVSLRLGEPPSAAPVLERLALRPTLRFKLDATPSWDEALIAELVATDAVASIDFKGTYKGTDVDVETDPGLYRRVVEAFPDAWLEDPHLTEQTDAILLPHRDRVTWDAPIQGIADIMSLPFPVRAVNVKPSRIGSLEELCDTYDFLAREGMQAYGGGQYELGIGRAQIQQLAALFHPDGPNDIAPGGYDALPLDPALPDSPLTPPLGFGDR